MKDTSIRVLIIEDSEDAALLIIRELKKDGYNPVYELVETAAAMKKALKEKQWDIILCDYNMPKFNAPSAIALLKETNIDIPIIVEAMASHRPYRAALGIEIALEEIEKNKGILYDNDVADACLRLFRKKGYSLVLKKN